jgi:predicted porin
LALAGLAMRQIQSKRSKRMQKKLLTLAVAGALAAPGLALAQVEVYGFVNMSFGKFKYSAPTDPTVGSISKWDVASHASNFGIRGRENIGGGQTAWFQIEQNAPMERSNNVATTPASRNSAVGIQGGWGNLFMGIWTTPWSDLDALWGIGTVGGWGPITSIIGRRETSGVAPNPNCANGISPGAGICDAVESAGGVGHPFWRRFSNAVFYQSPVFGGFQAKVAYMTNEGKALATATSTAADPAAWSGSVQWAGMGGRLRVGAAYDRHEDFTTIGQSDTGWRVTGGWNFGFADIGLAYEEMTYKCGTGGVGCGGAIGDVEAKQYGIGIAVPIGAGAIRGAYAIAKDLSGATFAGNDDSGAKTWNIGYEHRFSKRTSVGVGYAVIKNDSDAVFTWTGAPPTQTGGALPSVANTPLAGSDPSTFFVNMIHRF